MALEKQQTGIAAEYYVAAELSRLGYDVTVTFGNTKSIDLLVHKNEEVFVVQVKGIQATKSLCWNLNKNKVADKKKLIIVLVNLHVNDPKAKPEFFVLTQPEAMTLFNDTPKEGMNRTYLDYKKIKLDSATYQDRWTVFDNVKLAAL
jgi:Holliday junction resolvase-like predicted endonuclease